MLDHINLTVRDVKAASTFFKTYFGYEDYFEDNNAGMSSLTNNTGMYINLMKGSEASYPKYFHIGFDLETEDRVSDMYARLEKTGIVNTPPEHTPWGVWTFHFTCPGGDFDIEVACTSADGSESDWTASEGGASEADAA